MENSIQRQDFSPPVKQTDVDRHLTAVGKARVTQEIQGAIFAAKADPRDEREAERRIVASCERISLAEQAMYQYSRGGTKIEGPSIRLAETMARHWGNIRAGTTEVERRDDESVMVAFAWDLETNTFISREFTVPHSMKARDSIKHLEDPRDIYEHTANMAARRLRACILSLIPQEIQDEAIRAVRNTLTSGIDVKEQSKKMVAAFEGYGVTPEHLEEYLGYSLNAIDANGIVRLRGVYQSLRDGMGKPEDYFKSMAPEKPTGDPNELTPGKKQAKQAKSKSKKQPEPKTPEQEAPEADGREDLFADDDAPADDDPATPLQVESMRQVLGLRLSSLGFEKPTAADMDSVLGFLCLDAGINHKEPTVAEVRQIKELINEAKDATLTEAMVAD